MTKLSLWVVAVLALFAVLATRASASLIFSDQFAGTTLSSAKWNTFIASRASRCTPWNPDGAGGSGPAPNGYNAAYFKPSQVKVNDGLTLTAVRGSTRPGYTWTSGVISTCGKFAFDGGNVQVRAKVPAGDGMWPAIGTLPGSTCTCTTDNYEIDTFEGGLLGPPAETFSWRLHNGARQWGGVFATGQELFSAYHTYGLQWVPGRSLAWSLDGTQIAKLTSAQAPIPNEPMELFIWLGVASGKTSGWHQPFDSSTPSPSVMRVSSVLVYH